VFSQVDTAYDAMDRKTKETVSSGGTAYAVTRYGYDGSGRLQSASGRVAATLSYDPLRHAR
jgi:hypothetical protein